jgi:hypothetical protein
MTVSSNHQNGTDVMDTVLVGSNFDPVSHCFPRQLLLLLEESRQKNNII